MNFVYNWNIQNKLKKRGNRRIWGVGGQGGGRGGERGGKRR